MTRYAALLRGINVGPHRRIPMPALRDHLRQSGFADVETYVQSGNVVVSSELAPDEVARHLETVIADRFGFDDVPVVVRTGDELARVVALDPLGHLVTEPKRYQVSFLSGEPRADAVAALLEADVAPEAVHVAGREIYAWHPDGVQRSTLARMISDRRLGVTVTARNWTTVRALLGMVGERRPAPQRP